VAGVAVNLDILELSHARSTVLILNF
jgi:hypothetical protein